MGYIQCTKKIFTNQTIIKMTPKEKAKELLKNYEKYVMTNYPLIYKFLVSENVLIFQAGFLVGQLSVLIIYLISR